MQIKTSKERKALRDGYCARLRKEHIQRNPYCEDDPLYKIWIFGWNNIPDLIIGKKEFTIKWACFKCGSLYEEESEDEKYILEIYRELMYAKNFCIKCGDGAPYHLKFSIKADKHGWSW